MRVVMVTQFYAPVVGGQERAVENMSKALVRRGHDVAVVTLWHRGLRRFEVVDGVRVHRIRGTLQRGAVFYADEQRRHTAPFPDPEAVRHLRRVIERERPDVIHAHDWLVHSLRLHNGSHVPVVMSVHDHSLVCANKRLMRNDAVCTGPGLTKCARCASAYFGVAKGLPVAVALRARRRAVERSVDRFLPVSASVAATSRAATRHRPVEVIPNFVPSPGAAGADEHETIDGLPAPGFLLFVGDATDDKGIAVLLDAYNRMVQPPPLVVIGRPLSRSLRSPPRGVVVLGARPHEQVLAAYRSCVAVVMPSLCPETFGLTALEAMASERPVIVADSGALGELVVDGESGFVVPPGDASSLALALTRMVADRDGAARMGAAARARSERYSEDRVVAQLERVYREASGADVEVVPSPDEDAIDVLAPVPPAEHEVSADVAPEPTQALRTHGWGAVPLVCFLASAGVLLVAAANALSRSGRNGGNVLFWAGIALAGGPTAWFSLSKRVTRAERVWLVAIAGLALYAAKVVRDPFGFTFADELVHQANAEHLLGSGRLFASNSILAITPRYPGLASLTAALASTTHLSTYGAGLIVIGAARLVAVLAIFLLVERVTGSSRTACLATLVYAGTPNFLYFTAEYAYESLALPLLFVVLFFLAARGDSPIRGDRMRWTACAIVLVPAIAATHHVTSYALAGGCIIVCVLSIAKRAGGASRAPWSVATASVAAPLLWFALVARSTGDYLSPVFRRAISQSFQVAVGQGQTRQLFKSTSSTAPVTPQLERAVGAGSVVLLLVLIAFGLLVARRVWTRNSVAALLALVAVGYAATLPLRLVPAAWETSQRASEYLFVGIAAVVAAVPGAALDDASVRRLVGSAGPVAIRAAATGAVGLIVAGAIINGWPSDLRLGAPYRLRAGGTSVDPPSVAAATWSKEFLGSGHVVAAEQADARLLQAYGRQHAIAGVYPDVQDFLHAPAIEEWHFDLLRTNRIEFVAVDRRVVSGDAIAGYFFARTSPLVTFPTEVTEKLQALAGVDRIYDNGSIVIYDVRRIADAPAAR